MKIQTDNGLKTPADVFAPIKKDFVASALEAFDQRAEWVSREEAVKLFGKNSTYFSTWYKAKGVRTRGHRNNKQWNVADIKQNLK